MAITVLIAMLATMPMNEDKQHDKQAHVRTCLMMLMMMVTRCVTMVT